MYLRLSAFICGKNVVAVVVVSPVRHASTEIGESPSCDWVNEAHVRSHEITTPTGPPDRIARARALAEALGDLDDDEKAFALDELRRLCGVDRGEDAAAWLAWLDEHATDNSETDETAVVVYESHLPPDRRVMSGLLQVVADRPQEDGAAPEADRSGFPSLEGYELLERIGEGGMGTVYRARQVSLKRDVAVKVLRDRLAGDDEFIARFMREARLAASLSSPNIVRAIDVGVSGSTYYFAMELVEGEAVDDILSREGTLPERRAVEIALDVARALEYARTHGLIHRDVKPGNILIDREGAAMLADMGLARAAPGLSHDGTQITMAATMVGTADYISPEQARGQKDVDTRTDVYALGATLFHMLAGRPPFTGESQADVISKHLNEAPPDARELNPRVDAGTSLAIRMALEKDRARRYATPEQMASDLEDIRRGDEPRIASAQYGANRGLRGAFVSSVRRLRRSRWGAPALAAAVALGIVLGVVLMGRREPVTATQDVPAAAPPRPAADDAGNEPPPVVPAPRDPAYTAPLERARESLSRGEYGAALEQLEMAASLGAGNEVASLVEEAKFGQHRAAGRASEDKGDVTAAARSFARALAVRDDAELRAHAAELERRLDIERSIALGDRLFDEDDWPGSLEAYRTAQRRVRDGDRARLGDRLANVKKRITYLGAMIPARAALKAQKWVDAITMAKFALAVCPEDEPAKAIVETATRARHEESRRESYEEFMADARRRLAEEQWLAAGGAAERALALSPDAEEAKAIVEKARRGAEAVRQSQFAEEMAAAEAAKRAGNWPHVATYAKAALAMLPERDDARALRELAETELARKKRITNSLGMTFALVSGNEFMMGSDDGGEDERPARRVYLDSYYVSVTEVTNAQYESFRPGARAKWRRFSPADDTPAVCVSWRDATSFCEWLSKTEGLQYRLPTEAEWERAARGRDGRAYPWGNDPPVAEGRHRANYAPQPDRKRWADDGHAFAAPVGSFAASGSTCGAVDMAGNVWEWCLDWYAPRYPEGRGDNPRGPASGEKKVLRGGSFTTSHESLRCAARAAHVPGFYDVSVGFRCVLVPSPGPAGDASKDDER